MMKYKALKDIATITMGQSPDSSSYNEEKNGIPFYQGNADFGELYPTARVWCSKPQKIAKENDILISVRAPIGALNYATEECCIGRGLAAITIENDFERNYVFHFLKAQNKELNNKGTGSTFKAISKSVLEEIQVPVISKEQQEISMKLLDIIEQIIRQRKQELQKLDELIKARFVEMFYDKGYPVLKWNDVFNTTTGKLDSNAAVDGGTYPFFTCSKEVLRIDDYAFEEEALLLAGNNAAGKYDVKYYSGKFNAYQRTYVLTLKENWSHRLFQYQLEDKLAYLQQQSLGGLTKYLTLKILGELEFIIPPKKQQDKFDLFIKQVDKSKVTIQKALDETQLLFDGLMQKYFG